MHTPSIETTRVSFLCTSAFINQFVFLQLAATRTESLLNAIESIQGHPLDACEALHVTMQEFVSQIIGFLAQESKYIQTEVCLCVC